MIIEYTMHSNVKTLSATAAVIEILVMMTNNVRMIGHTPWRFSLYTCMRTITKKSDSKTFQNHVRKPSGKATFETLAEMKPTNINKDTMSEK
jgi:hypothetical protein